MNNLKELLQGVKTRFGEAVRDKEELGKYLESRGFIKSDKPSNFVDMPNEYYSRGDMEIRLRQSRVVLGEGQECPQSFYKLIICLALSSIYTKYVSKN